MKPKTFAWRFASAALQDDREVVLAACNQDGEAPQSFQASTTSRSCAVDANIPFWVQAASTASRSSSFSIVVVRMRSKLLLPLINLV